MANSFVARRLRFTLVLADTNSVFPGTGSNTLILTDMRASAIIKASARVASHADVRIYGMKAADMDALSVIWANPPIIRRHFLIVEASTGATWAQVFSGTIIQAQPDYADAPRVAFAISARTGYFEKINPVPPTSYSGLTSIQTIAQDLSTRMGFALVDGGATGSLDSPYLCGTLYDQFEEACNSTNIDFYFLGGQIVITSARTPRTQQPSVILRPTTGLIGYPQYEASGLVVRAIFDPAFSCAVPVQVDSSVPGAKGLWYPYALVHLLDARVPDGEWMSIMQCLRVLV